MQRVAVVSLLLVLGVLAAGCRMLGSGSTPAPALDGTWRLVSGSLDGSPIDQIDGAEPTLHVDGTAVGGRSGCNIYDGRVAIDGSAITVSALSMTEMGCDADRMALETAYLAALGRVEMGVRDGDRLTLGGAGVQLDFAPVPPVADADPVGTTRWLRSLLSGGAELPN